MSYHEPLRRQFLQQAAQASPQPDKLAAPLSTYGVRTQPARPAADAFYWRLVGIHHLTPEQNRGGHQVFVDVVDEQGARLALGQAQVQWGWEGQGPNEASPPRALDKPANEPAAVIDLYAGQRVWVEIAGQGLSSDRVANLHTGHADEPGPNGELWNSWGHHSYYLVFQRARAQGETPGTAATPAKPVTTGEPKLEVLTFGPVSNQDILNAFALASGQLQLTDPWALLGKAGLDVAALTAQRWARYSGAPIHELPGLSVSEKNLLMRQLAHVLATMPVPPVVAPPEPPPAPEPMITPTPEAPPTPPTPRPGNRLGFYLHLSIDQHGLWEAIRQVQPPVLLIHADTANRMLLREIRAFRAPDAFVVGRLYKDNDTQRRLLTSSDPSAAGRAMAEEILALDFGLATERGANGRLLIDAWMSLNEAVPGPASRQYAERPAETAAMLRAYDLFQTAFQRRLHEAGVESVAFNFAAGNFTHPEHYLDHFPNTLAACAYLGFHEYGWPSLHPAPGTASSAGLYRACMTGIRERYGPRHRAIITEAGLTRMFQDESAGDVGWLNPDRPLSQEEYWQTLAWYNQHLLADDYVVGACLYEVGHHGDWATFRHLGSDHLGRPLRLVEQLMALSRGRGAGRSRGSGAPRPLPRSERPRSTPSAPRGRGTRGLRGFVGVQGDELLADGRPLRFVGVNIRGLVHYGDGRTLPHATRDHAREQIRAARAMGARVIRVFLPSIHADTQTTIDRLRGTLALLAEEAPDAYLLPALCNFYQDVEFRIPGDDPFYARVDPHFPGNLLNAAFFQGGYRTNYLPFVQQVVQAFRDEPAIMAWEIGNELKLNPVGGDLENDPNIAAFLAFMHTVAQEIRRLDPNHLVTTGMISTHHAWLHTPALRHRLYAGPHFDFLTVHRYNDEFQNDDSDLARELGKPLIVEEAGYGLGFGADRSPKMQEDMVYWFDQRGARGYMPWGFMATNQDIGDGDRDSGLDRTLHPDWEPLFNLLRRRADALAQGIANWQPSITAGTGTATGPTPTGFTSGVGPRFQPGQTVYSTDWVNMRRSPGHIGKLGDDIIGMLAPGSPATIQAGAEHKDGLLWWLVEAVVSGSQSASGWVAEATAAVQLLTTAKPRAQARHAPPAARRRGGARAAGRGTTTTAAPLFSAAYVNLRHTPGYVSKPGDDVIGQIPYGAKVERLGGPVSADQLTWWTLRAPLLDNSVATGWAAEVHVDGTPLLVETPPGPPPAEAGVVYGTPFQPDEALTLLAAVPLRAAASTLAAAISAGAAPLQPHSGARVVAGPDLREGMEWWQIAQTGGSNDLGWVPLTSAEGTRLLAATAVAQAIQVARPFSGIWPITQAWGLWPDYYKQFLYDGTPLKGHNGIDFGTPLDTPLLAADEGDVARVDYEPGGFGHFVLVRHRWGETLYAHLNRVDVAQGAHVTLGQMLGLSGNSGGSTGPHLHFGVRILPYRRSDGWGGFINPLAFMQVADLPVSRGVEARPEPMAPELPGRLRP